jgi:hypothetical protein
MPKVLTIRPDAKGRITLGKLAQGFSSFHATQDSAGRIILEPFAEVPAREKWLFENKSALTAVREGLDQSAQGRVRPRGSFARYAKDKID